MINDELTVSTIANRQGMTSILAVILVIIHLLKPILKFGRVFDESYPYMKFGGNQVKMTTLESSQKRIGGQTEGQTENNRVLPTFVPALINHLPAMSA